MVLPTFVFESLSKRSRVRSGVRKRGVFFDNVCRLDGAFDASVIEGRALCGIAKTFYLDPGLD